MNYAMLEVAKIRKQRESESKQHFRITNVNRSIG